MVYSPQRSGMGALGAQRDRITQALMNIQRPPPMTQMPPQPQTGMGGGMSAPMMPQGAPPPPSGMPAPPSGMPSMMPGGGMSSMPGGAPMALPPAAMPTAAPSTTPQMGAPGGY